MRNRNGLLVPGVIVSVLGLLYVVLGVFTVISDDARKGEYAFFHFLIGGALVAAGIVLAVLGRPGRYVANPDPDTLERIKQDAWERSGINPENSGRAKSILENPDDPFPLG